MLIVDASSAARRKFSATCPIDFGSSKQFSRMVMAEKAVGVMSKSQNAAPRKRVIDAKIASRKATGTKGPYRRA